MRVIAGKKALVTGAASGIGRAIALRLAKEGADLYLIDINSEGLVEADAEARRYGIEAVGVHCDVSQPQQVTESINRLLDLWGHLDILVNNAGVVYYGPTMNMTADQWDWLMSVNFFAPIQFTRELLPRLLVRPEAHILNVSSMFGLAASSGVVAYSASKFGLVGFSEGLRAEYGEYGLGVTALCPGFVRTKLFESAASDFPGRKVPQPPEWLCTSSEYVAEKSVQAIYRNKRRVIITPYAYMLYYTKLYAPRMLNAVLRLGNSQGQQKSRRKKAGHSSRSRAA